MGNAINKLICFFKNHIYDYKNAVLNERMFEWEIKPCSRCGKPYKSSIPKFDMTIPTPPRKVVI